MAESILVASATGPIDDRSGRRRKLALIAVVALALLLLPCGVINHGDGLARYAQTKALLRGSLAVPYDLSIDSSGQVIGGILPGADGRLYSKYGLGTSLIWVIPTALGMVAHRVTHVDTDLIAGFGISFVNPLIVLLTALSLRSIFARLTGKPSKTVVLVYLFGFPTLAYANTAFSEPLVGLLMLWACALPLLRPTLTGSVSAGAAAAAMVLVKPELTLAIACLLVLCITSPGGIRQGRLLAFAIAAGSGVAACLWLNLACRGSIFRFSYGDEATRFRAPWSGFRGYFVEPNRNLFLFDPGLLLVAIGICLRPMTPEWGKLRWVVLALWALYVPFYSSWYAWEGGMCFGPRFFQSFVPVTVLFAGLPITRCSGGIRWGRAASTALVVASLPLQLAGLEVKNEEAVHVSEMTGRSEPTTHLQLLALKLARGIRAPEVWHASDFVRLSGASPDRVLDYRGKRTFQYLNNWWLSALSDHLRKGQPPSPDSTPVGTDRR